MTRTGLDGYLKARGFTRLIIFGPALDYCVAWTTDGRQAGFDIAVVSRPPPPSISTAARAHADRCAGRHQPQRDGLDSARRQRDALLTPMHMVQSARLPPVASSWLSAVIISRPPEAPSGWPKAMAPPLGFTFSDRRSRPTGAARPAPGRQTPR